MTRTLVVTSTFPQWDSDPRGAFIRRFWEARTGPGAEVEVLVPRTAWCRGELRTPLLITRFGYAPAACSTLTGQYGILENLRARPARALLLPPFFAGLWRAARGALAAGRWDRVVAHMLVPCGVTIAGLVARAGVPLELYGHGTDVDLLLATPAALRPRVAARLGLARVIHLPSRDKRARLLGALPSLRGRCQVATMAETVVTEPPPRRPVPGRVLFLGRLIRQKGVDALIDAVATLEPPAHLCVAGDGPERVRLAERAARNRVRVAFHGFVEGAQKRELLRTAAVVCVPSREVGFLSEGAPLVLREARAHGVPVVATRVGGIPELCPEGDPAVTLVPPGDPHALRTALRRRLATSASPPVRDAAGDYPGGDTLVRP